MKFTVNKGQLEAELALAIGCTNASDSANPALSKIELIGSLQGHLYLKTTNQEMAYFAKIDAHVAEAGTVMVDAKRLHDHMDKVRGESVQVSLSDGRVAIKCGRNNTKLPVYADKPMPTIPERPEPILSVPGEVLAGLLGRVAFAISDEDSRFVLTAAQLEARQEKLLAVATNCRKLSLAEHNGSLGDVSLKGLLTKKAIAVLTKIQGQSEGQQVDISITEKGHLFFSFGSRVLFTQAIEGKFPENYGACFIPGKRNKVVVLSSDLKDALECVSGFADTQSNAVSLKFGTNVLAINASHAAGESEEELDVAYDGPAINIGLSAKFVLEFLRLAGERNIEIFFVDAAKPVEFRVENQPDWAVVIMPMVV